MNEIKNKKIFIICPVRLLVPEQKIEIDNYVSELESKGNIVHLPYRDTDQTRDEISICTQNRAAIEIADEIHIYYLKESTGIHFDMGMAWMLRKKIAIIKNGILEQPKSFAKMLSMWGNL
jgi:hypothetical protein